MPMHCVWRPFVLHRVLGGPSGPVFCVFVFWAGTTGLCLLFLLSVYMYCFVFSCFGRPIWQTPPKTQGPQGAEATIGPACGIISTSLVRLERVGKGGGDGEVSARAHARALPWAGVWPSVGRR